MEEDWTVYLNPPLLIKYMVRSQYLQCPRIYRLRSRRFGCLHVLGSSSSVQMVTALPPLVCLWIQVQDLVSSWNADIQWWEWSKSWTWKKWAVQHTISISTMFFFSTVVPFTCICSVIFLPWLCKFWISAYTISSAGDSRGSLTQIPSKPLALVQCPFSLDNFKKKEDF